MWNHRPQMKCKFGLKEKSMGALSPSDSQQYRSPEITLENFSLFQPFHDKHASSALVKALFIADLPVIISFDVYGFVFLMQQRNYALVGLAQRKEGMRLWMFCPQSSLSSGGNFLKLLNHNFTSKRSVQALLNGYIVIQLIYM